MSKSLVSIVCALSFLAAAASFADEPKFLARRDYKASAFGIAVADTNGDKIPDIICVGGNDEISVLLGSGNGTFRQGPTSNVVMAGFGPPITADFNGNGNVDIITSGGENDTGGVGIFFGNGDGTFQPAVYYQTGSDVYLGNVVLGNFNGDGPPDLAVSGESGIWLFTGKAGGAFNPGVLVPFANPVGGNMAVGDFNRDGRLDFAVSDPSGFSVFLGNGNGTFQPPKSFTVPSAVRYLAVGDLNLDGYPDLVVSSTTGDAYIYLNDHSGGFSDPRKANIPPDASVTVGDVNGDGIPDLVSSAGYIALGNAKYYPLPGGIYVSSVLLADLRNNGLTDLVFQNPNSDISVLLSFGKGRYEDGEWTAVAGGTGCGVAADFNNDGKPDLAVNTPSGISILLGTGNALSPFAPGAGIALPGAGCLTTGDVNGDHIPDLLVPVNGTVMTYLGNGDGTFTLKSTTATPTGGYLALGDFNHDGKLDFATSGNLLALGNGDGTFQQPVQIEANLYNGLTNIGAGDFNGDGWTDLVITYSYDSYMYVLINNQHGGFTETKINALTGRGLPIDPDQVLLVDLDGDGNLDMVLGPAAAVYLGDGKGGFSYHGDPGDRLIASGPIAVSDINGDGIPDLVAGGATLSVYLGKGDGSFSLPFYIGAGPSPGDIVLESLHGQKAGLADIVAPDVSGGVMVLINATR